MKFAIFTSIFLVIISTAYAIPVPGHPASHISGGTFDGDGGDFSFPTTVIFQQVTGCGILATDAAGKMICGGAPVGGGELGGSGNAQYLSRFTGPTVIGDSVVYQSSSGNIGIGTTTPPEKLSVEGVIRSSGGIRFSDNSLQTTAWTGAGGTGPWIPSGTNIYNSNTGNVGIGTTNPQAKLEIDSGLADRSGLRFTKLTQLSSLMASSGKVLTVDTQGNVALTTDQTGAGSGITGSGTTNTLPFFSGPTTLASSTLKYYSSSMNELDILGPAGYESFFIVQSDGTHQAALMTRMGTDNNRRLKLFTNPDGQSYVQAFGTALNLQGEQVRFGVGGDAMVVNYINSSPRVKVFGNIQSTGTIESTSGGFKFPDGTTQATAATGGGTIGGSGTTFTIPSFSGTNAIGDSSLKFTNSNKNELVLSQTMMTSTWFDVEASGANGNEATIMLRVNNDNNKRLKLIATKTSGSYVQALGNTLNLWGDQVRFGVGGDAMVVNYINSSPRVEVFGVLKATSVISSSDARLKSNIKPLGPMLDHVLHLQPAYFTWNGKTDRQIGLIAQDVEKEIPELVVTFGEDGYKGLDYDKFSAVLVKAIQEQQTQITSQKNAIKTQQQEIDLLKKENAALRKRMDTIEQR